VKWDKKDGVVLGTRIGGGRENPTPNKTTTPTMRRPLSHCRAPASIFALYCILMTVFLFTRQKEIQVLLNDAPYYSTTMNDERNQSIVVHTYRHYNTILLPANECTDEQRIIIYNQLNMSNGEVNGFTCQDTDWLNAFFEDEVDIGSATFVGISVGCNKGTDAIVTARMGMRNSNFDISTWNDALGGGLVNYCPPQNQGNINFPQRKGEMHCIEPTFTTYQTVKQASEKLKLDATEFVVSHAAIASRDGTVKFPNPTAGVESCGIHGCQGVSVNELIDVNMYSLDSYVEKFVQSKGPINILNIDAEGWDFHVLFGSSSVLDRTYYVEFEYHMQGLFHFLLLFDLLCLASV
jgi:FkbM family methyltransferase